MIALFVSLCLAPIISTTVNLSHPSNIYSFNEEKAKIMKSYKDMFREKTYELQMVKITEPRLPISDLLNHYNPTSLMEEMQKKETEVFFLVIFWYNYDSTEHLILPKKPILAWLALKNSKDIHLVLSRIMLNFTDYIIGRLASSSYDIDLQIFLNSAKQLYEKRFFGLINYSLCADLKDRHEKYTTLINGFENAMRLFQSMLDENPFGLFNNEFPKFRNFIIKGDNSYSINNLVLLNRYITLKKTDPLELLSWLLEQPPNISFFFLFFQSLPLDVSGTTVAEILVYAKLDSLIGGVLDNLKKMIPNTFRISPNRELLFEVGISNPLKELLAAVVEKISLVDKI